MSLAYSDGRCALPAAPHRTRTAVRAVGSALGQAHWPPPQAGATSGRWPTVPGVTHLIACAQVGPIPTPGGPPNPRGRVPHQRLFAGSCHPNSPPFVAVFVPAFLPSSPGASPCPAPLAVPPGPRHVPSAPAVCPCSGVLVSFVVFFFCFFSVPCPPPCHLAFSSLSSPFSWVGGGVGRGGGGLAVRPIAQARRKHGAGMWRGTCSSAGGGGLPCGSRRHPTLPAVAPLVVPPLGPARRVLPVGTVVWFVPHSRSSASPPCRGALGGGVRFPLPSSPMSPRLPLAALAPFLGGCGGWGWGGGGALAALPPA